MATNPPGEPVVFVATQTLAEVTSELTTVVVAPLAAYVAARGARASMARP
jgi:hypothetical protein